MSESHAQITRHRPDFLDNKPHFTNLVISEGGKTIHMSGLVATTADGKLVGSDDLSIQMNFIYDNIKRALAGQGATPANVVRQRVFIVGMRLDNRPIIASAMHNFYGDTGTAASTCVGVEALLVGGALVEIDVTAVIDR